ncbi:MAG: PrsW family intramembrane metalloprotease [Solobacterium sp.]|nr:PrsW family intramembrane metalloprotease [Solobacterium sp.]
MLEYFSPNVYTVLITLAALVPAIILLVMIYRLDKVEKEPSKLLMRLFLFGVASAFPAALLEQLTDSWILPSLPIQSETLYILLVALSVGLIEEICKFFFLFRTTWNHPHFNYRFDGIVYAVFVSLGFAAIENVLYVFQFGLEVALLRAVLALPGHTAFGIFMGAYYGRAKIYQVQGKKSSMTWHLILSYIIAAFLHAFYDGAAMLGTTPAMIVFFLFVGMMYIITIRLVKKESKEDTSVY